MSDWEKRSAKDNTNLEPQGSFFNRGHGGKKEFSKRRYYKLKTPFGMRMKVEYKKGQACVALTPKRWYWGWFYLTKTKPAKWHRFPMWIYGLFYITVKGLVGGIDGQA